MHVENDKRNDCDSNPYIKLAYLNFHIFPIFYTHDGIKGSMTMIKYF